MSDKIRKMLHSQKGFTLIELMTVLIILGVILGIGVPKYLKIQAKAEWDADVTTITNIAKAAETYAAQKNNYSPVGIKNILIANGIIDGNTVLNRTIGAENKSVKNESKTPLYDGTEGMLKTTDQTFSFNEESGRVTKESLDNVVLKLIGTSPY